MAIWIVPFVIVFVIIGIIGWRAVRGFDSAVVLNEKDQGIPDAVEDHPYGLNPIIWIIGVAALFILFVIFFYWASSV